MKSIPTPPATRPDPSPIEENRVLSRDELESGALQDRLAHAAGQDALWTMDQIEASLEKTMRGVEPRNLWVFGYGSLIWNPIFPVSDRRNATIYGYRRALCLSSVVGRGTRDRPGVMLALDAGGSCRGVALKMAGDDVTEELRLLWRREMFAGSYTPKWVQAHFGGGAVMALTFVANRSRPNYVGRLPDEEAVCRLSTASGPLGTNLDYLRRTHAGLEAHGIMDARIARLLANCNVSPDKREDR